MTQSIRDFDRSFVCGSASLITKQFYIVKQDTDGTLILSSAATDKHVGVLLNKPAVGVSALVRLGMGTCKVVAGGTITVGAWVTSDSNGKAVATTTNKDNVIGKFLGAASAASGDIIEVQMDFFTLSS